MSLYIGLMSGTSMDAVDAVLVSHAQHPPSVLAAHSHSMPVQIRRVLKAVVDGSTDGPSLWRLDAELGELFAAAVCGLLDKAGVSGTDVVAIGSHGQTVYHGPRDVPPVTVQLADPNIIAERTGITTVADFRRRDMAAGGQGAPLAPAFHRSVFQSPDVSRVVVNIGGIANITVLPRDPGSPVIGFDTGPGNTLMDLWCERHRGTPMDEDGVYAASGTLVAELLDMLRADPYFELPPPKSTGREYFNLSWLQRTLDAHEERTYFPEDVQRTLCELTADSIADAVEKHAPDTDEILVCGGGAHNPVLINSLSGRSEDCMVTSTASLGLDPGWIEGIAFSWMAKQTLDHRPSNLPSVTGARRAVVLGGIYPA